MPCNAEDAHSDQKEDDGDAATSLKALQSSAKANGPSHARTARTWASLFADVAQPESRDSNKNNAGDADSVQSCKQPGQPKLNTAQSQAQGSSPSAKHERARQQAYRSPVVAGGKLKCNACGRLFTGMAFLAQHLRDVHDGVNKAGAPRKESTRAVGSSSVRQIRKNEQEDHARVANISDIVSHAHSHGGKAAQAPIAAASATPQHEHKPSVAGGRSNLESSRNVMGVNSMIKHRGKHREDGRKRRKKPTSLKKAILQARKNHQTAGSAATTHTQDGAYEGSTSASLGSHAFSDDTSTQLGSSSEPSYASSFPTGERPISNGGACTADSATTQIPTRNHGLKPSAQPFIPQRGFHSDAAHDQTPDASSPSIAASIHVSHLAVQADEPSASEANPQKRKQQQKKAHRQNSAKTYIGDNANFSWYADQVITRELNNKVTDLLKELIKLHESLKERNPSKASMRKRYVTGLRECEKAVRAGKCRLLILAPNIEEAGGERGTNAKLQSVLSSCNATGTPRALALTRSKLGGVFKQTKVSSCAVLDTNGVEGKLHAVVDEVNEMQERFQNLFPQRANQLKQMFHPDNSPVPAVLRKH